MTLTPDNIADEFLAAAKAAGLKKVMVQVGKIAEGEFIITITLPNPVSFGEHDQVLAASCYREFASLREVKEIAADRARAFVKHIPTIH